MDILIKLIVFFVLMGIFVVYAGTIDVSVCHSPNTNRIMNPQCYR